MKQKSNRKIYILLGITSLIGILIIGFSYAYTHGIVINKESTSTVIANSAILDIIYNDPSTGIETTSEIVEDGIIPGWSTTKRFTLSGKNTTDTTNELDSKMFYRISIMIEENTFSEGAIHYELVPNALSQNNGKTVKRKTGLVASSGKQTIGTGYFDQTNEFKTHVYDLTISFPETNENQIIDINKSLGLYVNIEEMKIKSEFDFGEDSWETIAINVQLGNASKYNVGDIKCVKIEGITPPIDTECGDEEFAVRLVNNSTPSECNTEGFSQTACGFVLEFADVITRHNMNSTDTNVGGWPASSMREFLSTDIYNALPEDLQNIIIDTTVVSSHGSDDSNPDRIDGNWESYDKLYLLSTKEIYGDCGDNPTFSTDCGDTAINVTRQLDWYNADIEGERTQVTITNYDESLINTPIKHYQAAQWYWLRSAASSFNNRFMDVTSNGSWFSNKASSTGGLAPAFRIG